MSENEKAIVPPGGAKEPLSPLAEALARQAAMRPARGPAKQLPPIERTPKVKAGRRNRRKIPK